MPHFFEKKDRWGNGLALWVVVGMVFLIPISLWSLFSLRVENEVRNWLRRDNPDYQTVEWYRRHFPLDEVFLFTWEGSSLDDPRVDRLVQKIQGTPDATGKRRGASKLIDRVTTPQGLIAQMRKNKVPSDEAIARLEGVLVGSGPLCIRLTEYGRARREKVVGHLRQAAHESLGIEIAVTEPSVQPSGDASTGTAGAVASRSANDVPSDPVEAPGTSVARSQTDEEAPDDKPSAGDDAAAVPHDLAVTWRGMHWDSVKKSLFVELAKALRLPSTRSRDQSPPVVEDCFQVPGSPIALAVYLSEAGSADRDAAFRWLMAAAEEAGIAPDTVHMAGNCVAGASLDREVRKAVWDESTPPNQLHRRSIILLSGLGGGILTFWLLRSFRLAGLVLGVSYLATLLSSALVPMTGGAMNVVLVVMPTLILVTTVSAAIHLANYWQHAAAANLKTALGEAVKTAYGPCLWAGLASAIGQASLITSSLAPVRDFGLYAAAGTLISLVVILYGLPALLQIWPGKSPRPDELGSAFWQGLAGWIAARHKMVCAVSLVISVICMWGLTSFKTETKTIRCFSNSTRTVKDYDFIEDNLGGAVPVDVIVRFDRESQQGLKFLQRRDLVQKIESEMKQLPDVSGSFSMVDFLPAVSAPGEHAGMREKSRYNATSRTIEDRVKGEEQAASRSLLSVADDVTQFNAEGDELWRITALVGVMSQRNYQELRSQLDEICSAALRGTSGGTADKLPPAGKKRSYHPGASHVVTGDIPLFLATQQELLRSVIFSFAVAFGGITLVVMIVLRHPAAGLLAVLSNVLPIGAVLGLISWYGVPVDVGSALTASIALGIAVGGTLHLVTWFRLAIEQGKSRSEAVGLALGHCGPTMWQTTLVAGIGLLMLSSADLVLIGRFGWIMAALLASASASGLVLTPALLAGPLGHFIEKCNQASCETAHAADADHDEPAASAGELAASIPGKPHIGKKNVRIRRVD